MNLRTDTIAKLKNTIYLDEQDLEMLGSQNAIKMAKVRGVLNKHNADIKSVKADLNGKKRSLAFMESEY